MTRHTTPDQPGTTQGDATGIITRPDPQQPRTVDQGHAEDDPLPWPPAETGPCARCGTPGHRYGPGGNPVCSSCRTTPTTSPSARPSEHHP